MSDDSDPWSHKDKNGDKNLKTMNSNLTLNHDLSNFDLSEMSFDQESIKDVKHIDQKTFEYHR